MKILESAPYLYDKGIKILTLGKIDKTYDKLIEYIREGDRVLDKLKIHLFLAKIFLLKIL